MPDILSDPVLVQKQIKTRAHRITIMNKKGVDPNLNFESEYLLLLDGAPSGSNPAPPVTRNMSGVATHLAKTIDPVTGLEVTASAACVALLIEELYCKWFKADDTARIAFTAEIVASKASADAAIAVSAAQAAASVTAAAQTASDEAAALAQADPGNQELADAAAQAASALAQAIADQGVADSAAAAAQAAADAAVAAYDAALSNAVEAAAAVTIP